MRDVLVVLFWLWLLVAVGVYGYRIVRRVSQGPKAERQARAAAGATSPADEAAPPRTGLGRTVAPPLPEGPLEPRLPRSLAGVTPEGEPAATTDPAEGAPTAARTEATPGDEPPLPPAARPTLAEALAGISMPDSLLPVVDPALPGIADGRIAHFVGTGTTVAAVATALTDELRRLGYAVDGLDTMTTERAGLSGRRDGTTVSASIDIDGADASVRVQLHT